jgi:hypothetical protein
MISIPSSAVTYHVVFRSFLSESDVPGSLVSSCMDWILQWTIHVLALQIRRTDLQEKAVPMK